MESDPYRYSKHQTDGLQAVTACDRWLWVSCAFRDLTLQEEDLSKLMKHPQGRQALYQQGKTPSRLLPLVPTCQVRNQQR